ncbi:MAG: hypothetical protein JXR94_14585 [Candidatus Hydrogenedentes bacterium]|nr:hypothetical protein [Candidatus Hydrogenedentota bacterium]
MEVIVDGERGFALSREPADMFEAVAAVSDSLRAQGRAILAVQVDGQDVKPDRMIETLQGRPLDRVAELAVTSEDVVKLVDDCLHELAQALPDLPRACHELAAVFQSDKPEEAYEPFEQLAEIWEFVKSREIMAINALELDLATINVQGKLIRELHDELNAQLQEAIDALKAGDCVLLGDLLEYELAPRAEMEASIVGVLQAEAGRRSG